MTPRNRPRLLWATSLGLAMAAGPVAAAQSDAERIRELEARTAALAEELAELREEMAASPPAGQQIETLRIAVDRANQTANSARRSADEWRNTRAVTHLAGYAAAGYASQDNGADSFDVANFNPIFHFQYADRVLWESELEVEVEEDGSTGVALEYSAINIFVNDYLTFGAGKFVSPIGNFRQNIHPAWINKLPSAPPGFGHDGAAPLAEVGFQLRGGLPIGDRSKVTYTGYVGNGPKLEGEDGELHGVDTDGFTGDPDDEKVVGGRLTLLPVPSLEIGVSGAFGDAAVVENDGLDFEGDPARDYEVLGADFSYRWHTLDLRGEYVQQDIGDAAGSIVPEGGKWETWYLQGAYQFAEAKWEGVLRYTDFDSPHPDQTQEQWSVGLNYLLTPNAILKLGYEFNDGLAGEETDEDRWLLQVAYGY